ncbi:hypothetical protein BD289DRAFT_446496 [Coniella lustricola]|uniref:Zn(2)-C6 fungal-type domain-containing protein n=1 Tax=Coniella lustricola TaxID=2025994 RepID=A0A2T2ZTY3_9PEZI|nr:hypothetical protein BD289DRAFT_446496 [Coniella lustricola]
MTENDRYPGRACDRCHASKERCRWVADSTSCERCSRLQHVCRNDRPAKKAGRRPRDLPQPERRALEVSNKISACGNVSVFELQLLERAFTDEIIEEFVVGPSFCKSHRQLLISQIVSSADSLGNAFLACSLSWASDTEGSALDTAQVNACYRRASSALATLRSLDISNTEQMSHCITLGCLILTFTLKLRIYDMVTICSQTLNLIKPVYDLQRDPNPDEVALVSTLIVTELVECLLECKMPTLRYRTPLSAEYVDRYVGLSYSLLPHLHDICALSLALSRNNPCDSIEMQNALNSIESTVAKWQPSVPVVFSKHYQAGEVALMLCQVQVLRTAGLLILYRLRHPFGSNNAAAQFMSLSILTQLETTFKVTGKSIKCTEMALAIIVACFELQEEERKYWLKKIWTLVGYSTQFKEYVESIVSSLWTSMDTAKNIFWYNMHKYTGKGSYKLSSEDMSDRI